MNNLYNIAIIGLLIIFYYHFFKKWIRGPSYWIAKKLGLTKKYSVEESAGATGFIIVVITHFIFLWAACAILGVDFKDIGLNVSKVNYNILGLFLGIGIAGTVALLAMLMVKLLALMTVNTEKQIFLSLSCGWLKRYEYLKLVFPLSISIPFIICQLACEELVFRGLLLNYLFVYGVFYSITVSTIYFIMIQTFQMPTIRGALFPVLGALVMGPIHGYLFYLTHSIWPLIISHAAFFMVFTI